jgi:aminomethyltransferase
MTVTDADGNTVGEVTSGTFSPTLRQGIGLALLDAPVSEGQDVTVDVRGRKSVMTVVRPPFVKSSTAS